MSEISAGLTSSSIFDERPGLTADQSLWGEWLLTRLSGRTLAQHLSTRRELELVGELHEELFEGARLLQELAKVDPEISDLAHALARSPRPLTFDALLRGTGWRLLFVELTGKCNENCRHCYAQASPTVTAQLSWETVNQLLGDARELGFTRVQFTGGDPLISPHIEKAIRRADNLGFPDIEVFTNALALHAQLLELFVEKKVSVAVSLYSHRSDVHDAITQTPGSHERTTRAVRAALKRGIRVRIGGVQGIEDRQDEVAFRAYVKDLGVGEKDLAVGRQRPVGRGTWREEPGMVPGGHQVNRESDRGRLCVTYNAEVVPCIFDRSSRIGDLRVASLPEILAKNVPKAQRLPSPLKVVGEPLGCAECQFRNQLLSGRCMGP